MFEVYRLRDVDIDKCMGEQVCIKALASKVEVKNTKNNSREYLNVTLTDGSTKIPCKKWNATSDDKVAFIAGKVYELTVSVESWEGNLSCVIKGYVKVDESPMEYVERLENTDRYIKTIKCIRDEITPDSVYSKIVNEIITDEAIERMAMHPAARCQHHEMIGGLILHTATMAACGRYLSRIYDVNKDLVESAILLHDFMKLEEMGVDIETGTTSYSTEGNLIGHIVMMVIEVDKVAEKLGLSETEEVKLLKHCILAHHGKKEWGSPVEPEIREALLLSAIDKLDADMYSMSRTIEKIEPGTSTYEQGKVVYRANNE